MNKKLNRIFRSLMFFMAVPLVIFAFVFATKTDVNCEGISVILRNSEVGFVTIDDVKESLIQAGVSPSHSKLSSLDIQFLEKQILENPWIEDADIYLAANNKVTVQILQREASVRIQRVDSVSSACYLDAQGHQMPLSNNFYSPDVPIVSVKGPISQLESKKDVLKIAHFIKNDSFWNAAITQIHFNKKKEFELSSEIGTAAILFGSTDKLEDKFNRLLTFYQKGVSRINWENVKELDLRFDRQLVCRRYHEEKKVEELKARGMYAKKKVVPIKAKPVQKKKAVVKKVAQRPAAKPKNKAAKKGAAKKIVKEAPKKIVKKAQKAKKKTVKPKVVAKPKVEQQPKRKQIVISSEPISKN